MRAARQADYLHVHTEAKKLAFADRAKFYADPDFGGPSAGLVQGLISKAYAAERNKLLNMSRAAKTVPPGTPPSEAAVRLGFPTTAAAQALDETSADVPSRRPRTTAALGAAAASCALGSHPRGRRCTSPSPTRTAPWSR